MLFLVLSGTGYSQTTNTDSLEQVFQNSPTYKERISACKLLSTAYLIRDFDACLSAAKAGAELAEAEKDHSSLGELKKTIGMAWYFKGVFDSAANYYYKALDVLKDPEEELQKAGVLNELGKLYRKTRDLDRALQNYDEAFAIYKKRQDDNGMATILNESGVVFEYKEDYAEALDRYQRSLALREKMNDKVGQGYSLNFIGGVFTLKKDFVQAEKYLIRSLDIRRQLKDSFAIALNHADLGFMYTESGMYDKAIEQYGISNAIAMKLHYPDLLLGNYRELSSIAEKKGDPKLSLELFKKYNAIKDSVFSGEKLKQIEQLNAKYQAEKKEQQLKLQKAELTKKNYLLWGLILGIAMLVLAGFTFYRKRRIQMELKMQTELMKQQDLATKAIISAEENERKRIAADLHDGIGQMMSAAKMNLSAFENDLPFKDADHKAAFERVISLVDESCREIRSVSHQMMPNALLKSGLASAVREFIDKIDHRVIRINLYTEGLDEKLDSNVETVLYRVIQECVNNVIKHSRAGSLDISLIRDNDGISATVEDNGRGFDTSDKQQFEGIGLKNIISRIGYLKGTVDFDSAPGKGTLVAIHVPL
ncbi:MAG: sensor histidine kinase [Chitinophagaceae bacterium]|nr:sensor histidine kinase [Chitinophagaceae bacterium]MBL0056397.1 sensor histidine kinase [Chitinophagaceae bacterium]